MTEFKLPDIGEGIVECEVVEWRVQEGDDIVEDQPVVEVMTDKALVEITAPASGRVTRLHVAKGETAGCMSLCSPISRGRSRERDQRATCRRGIIEPRGDLERVVVPGGRGGSPGIHPAGHRRGHRGVRDRRVAHSGRRRDCRGSTGGRRDDRQGHG